MAQIPQINNPITSKNYNYSPRQQDQNTEPFDVVKLTGVGGMDLNSDSAAKNRLEMGNRELIPLQVQVAKDPTLAVEMLKDLLNVEVLNQALITGHTDLYGSLQNLAKELYVTPDQLVQEIQNQEQQNTMFSGHEFYDVLREVSQTTTDYNTKELIGNLLKSINFAQNKNEILGALRANMKFLSEYYSPNEKLSEKLLNLSREWGAEDADQYFNVLKGETLSILKDVSGSLLNDDKTQMLIPLIVHNISRYNNSPYLCKEYFSLLLTQISSGNLRDALKNSFNRLYSAIFDKNPMQNPNTYNTSGISENERQVSTNNYTTNSSQNQLLSADSGGKILGFGDKNNEIQQNIKISDKNFVENDIDSNRGLNTFGNIRDPEGRIMNSNGRVMDSDGRVMNSNDRVMDSEGRVINSNDRVMDSESRVMNSNDRVMDSEGRVMNSNERVTDSEGRVMNPNDIVMDSNKAMDFESGTVNSNNRVMDSEGRIMNSSDKSVYDTDRMEDTDGEEDVYYLDEDGNIVDEDGNLVEVDEYGNVIEKETDVEVNYKSEKTNNDDVNIRQGDIDEQSEVKEPEPKLEGWHKFLNESMSERSYMQQLKSTGYNIEHILANYNRGKISGMNALEQLTKGLFLEDPKHPEMADLMLGDMSKVNTMQELIDNLNTMLRDMPDIPLRERMYGVFVEIVDKMSVKNELPQHGIRPPVSSTLDNLTDFIQKNINNPALKSLDSFNASNLLQSLLNAPGVFTPLAHYILPLEVNNTRAFGELWVDNDENNPNNTPGTQRNYHLFLTFDIDSIGRFEVDMYAIGEDVNLSLLYPPRFDKEIGPMKERVTKIIRNSGYQARTFETAPLTKTHNLVDVFPKIVKNRKSLNTRV